MNHPSADIDINHEHCSIKQSDLLSLGHVALLYSFECFQLYEIVRYKMFCLSLYCSNMTASVQHAIV